MMETWEPDFVPRRKVIYKVVIWLRLLGVPMEFWKSSTIMAIAVEANKPLAMDNFTDLLRKMGYAPMRVKINLGKLLKLGV